MSRDIAAVVAPHSAVAAHSAAVRDVIRDAAAEGRRLRISAHGGWADAGRPVRADGELALAGIAGIIDYVPGDLTLTALAGTPLDAIARATGAEGQWLPLDPFGAADGTLGATIATASAGPLAHAFGLPRDIVLGLEFVSGRGAVVRVGGRVVKNVAGFDLTRLQIGAWGTLGALTEISVRLRARPEVDETVALALPGAASAAAALVERVRRAPLLPLALERVNLSLARHVGLTIATGDLLLARLGGNPELVAAQRATLAALGDVAVAPRGVWDALREAEPAGSLVLRLSALPALLASVWAHASALGSAASATPLLQASVGRGIVRLVLPDAERALSIPIQSGITVVPERLTAALWTAHDARRRTAGDPARRLARERLTRGVRDAFDPHELLNPGILG